VDWSITGVPVTPISGLMSPELTSSLETVETDVTFHDEFKLLSWNLFLP
jgi:hypothetical protein